MKNIIITDAKYRSSIAAVRALAGKNYNIILCQTDDCKKLPPAFSSKYVGKTAILKKSDYAEELLKLVKSCDRPVVLPIGAVTTDLLSREQALFSRYCDFLVPSPQALDAANDKQTVAETARKIGIPTPRTYDGEPESYPVIIKPSCGEKLGLKAEQRYMRADNREQYLRALEKMTSYGQNAVVQEYIEGDGEGVCLLISKSKETAGMICHRRIRELPVTGGPSTCCVTVRNQLMINQAQALLKELNFQGVAMVEFKGGRVLEINPRVWGSFPITYKANSNFTENWVACAAGEPYSPPRYDENVKMNFLLNDMVASFKYLSAGKISHFASAWADILNPFVHEALFSFKDPMPFFKYIISYL